MIIIDDFAPLKLHYDLVDLICDTQFNWTYTPNTYGDYMYNLPQSDVTEKEQFVHLLYKSQPNIVSNLFTLVRPLMYFVPFEYKDIDRMKVNLLCRDSSYPANHHHTPHMDAPMDDKRHKTLLYYLDSSDGDTVFFDYDGVETGRVSPKANRAVIFDSKISHASTSPRISQTRMVINTVFVC